MATMKEVAERAGVSITTVSHVANRTRNVRDGTRARVKQAMNELGYIHLPAAVPALTTRSRTLGVAVSSIADEYYSQVVAGIGRELERRNFTILLAETKDQSETELNAVHALEERGIQGLLIFPIGDGRSETLGYLRDRGLATVLLDRCISADFDQVGTENIDATARLVEHLAETGRSKIGLIHSLKRISTTGERIQGYRTGLKRAGLPFNPNLMAGGGASRQLAYDAVKRLMLRESPTGLVVCNGPMALGALGALRELGLQVPRDVAVVSFDDTDWGDHVDPPLTSGKQAVAQIAEESVRLMFDRLQDPWAPARTVRTVTTFVHRRSCGCGLGCPASI